MQWQHGGRRCVARVVPESVALVAVAAASAVRPYLEFGEALRRGAARRVGTSGGGASRRPGDAVRTVAPRRSVPTAAGSAVAPPPPSTPIVDAPRAVQQPAVMSTID